MKVLAAPFRNLLLMIRDANRAAGPGAGGVPQSCSIYCWVGADLGQVNLILFLAPLTAPFGAGTGFGVLLAD